MTTRAVAGTIRTRSGDAYKPQLIATTFARADFKMGKMLCQLIADHARAGSEYDFVLWTALGVIYARPFLDSNEVGRVGERTFERFDDERQLALHRILRTARNTTFAHTGVHPAQSVHVMPPGAFGKTGSATTGRAPFDHTMVGEIEALCDLQAQRERT